MFKCIHIAQSINNTLVCSTNVNKVSFRVQSIEVPSGYVFLIILYDFCTDVNFGVAIKKGKLLKF